MRFFKFFIIVNIILYLGSCHLDEKIAIDIDYNTEATIPSIIGIDLPFEIPIPAISTNINSKLESVNSKKEYLHTAKLQELTISALNPEDQSFNFLKKIEVYIKADGLDEVKIAEKQVIPEDIGNELDLDVNKDQDLSEYIKKDKFNLRVKATSRKVLLHSVKVNIYTELEITTDIF
jgi:hypothetical protein